MYLAHLKDDKYQSLNTHLKNVAQIASNSSIDVLKPYVFLAGMLHDIGKYCEKFQRRIRGENITVEHAIAGAQEVYHIAGNNVVSLCLSYCIAGHHTGLCDGGTKIDSPEMATLRGRLKRKPEDYKCYQDEVILLEPISIGEFQKFIMQHIQPTNDKQHKIECIEWFAFITRYIFSCLTDADYLDTEKFCNSQIDRVIPYNFLKGRQLLEIYMHHFKVETALQKARSDLQNQALSLTRDRGLPDIALLNMPTGSGKTLCSLQLALEELKRSKGTLKRIIYVIPYTSIIEQTAAIFESILGQAVPVVQHRNDMMDEVKEKEDPTTAEKLRYACENWDAPLIITTNIQFFESIYHFKGSKLRKLHHMQESIIILDEVHMMPLPYMTPCYKALKFLAKGLQSKIILMSATMPNIKSYFDEHMKVEDLIEDKTNFKLFATCKFSWLGTISRQQLIESYALKNSVLVIVNTKKRALTLYNECPKKNKYYLSTLLTSEDRTKIITQIRKDLKERQETFVFSTSLVEAGVDLDFESVYRELAGVDNILQAAGRCNREGLLPQAETYIFELEGENRARGDLMTRAMITKGILEETTNLYKPEVISTYYKRLYETVVEDQEKASIATCSDCNGQLDGLPFRTYASHFKLIDVTTIDVAVLLKEKTTKIYKEAQFGNRLAKRKLAKHCISLYLYEFEKLKQVGVVEDEGSGIYYLTNNDYYNEKTGLILEKDSVAYFDW